MSSFLFFVETFSPALKAVKVRVIVRRIICKQLRSRFTSSRSKHRIWHANQTLFQAALFLVILIAISAVAMYWLLLNCGNVDIVMVGTAQDFRVGIPQWVTAVRRRSPLTSSLSTGMVLIRSAAPWLYPHLSTFGAEKGS